MNTRGSAGKSVLVDLHNEHLTRKLKYIVSGVGVNIADELTVEASKYLNGVDTILCEHHDSATGIGPNSIHHIEKKALIKTCLQTVVKQLPESQVF